MIRGVPYLLLLSVLFLGISTKGVSSAQTFWPAAVPLAVRSPYFSAWQATTNGTNVTNEWPTFWDNNILGWAGHIRIDNETYRWLGAYDGPLATNLTSVQVTPTRTIYSVQAGRMDLTITFLTPIEPSDWVQQSIPFSYLVLEAQSNDGEVHEVQVYSDISAEWASGDRSAQVNWTTTLTSQVVYHAVELQTPYPFDEYEDSDQAEDGTVYYAMATNYNYSYQSGNNAPCRDQFINDGYLTNTSNLTFRGIDDNFPLFAFSVDLGNITSTQSPIMWSVGYVRDPSIEYTTSTGDTQLRRPYYVTQYSTITDLIQTFVSNFPDAQSRAESLDNELMQNASSITSQYSDLISLAARQAFGAIDITVPKGTDGNGDISDVMIFMKNMGTDRRVNPVEVMYASFPMFLYLNASFGKGLLAPLLEYQSGSAYNLPHAASDLGLKYPIASGDDSTVIDQGVEQSGNMLIMTLAHARASGDGSLIGQYYDLLAKWADYLVENALIPTYQVSADGEEMANMTNLAIKGIIGIRAMAEISQAYGASEDEQHYASVASTYASEWHSLALASNQENVLFSYGDANSWALMYNFYADSLLQTGLIDDTASLHAGHSTIGYSLSAFGLPIDSNYNTTGNSGWLAFTAATVSDTTARDRLIDMIWNRASYNLTIGVWPSVYSIEGSGSAISGSALPAQGAMFALLALNMTNKAIEVPNSPMPTVSEPSVNSRNIGAIVGGVVGGVVGLAAVLVAIFLWRRRSRRMPRLIEKDLIVEHPEPVPFPYNATPYGMNEQTGMESTAESFPLIPSKLREHMQSALHGQQHASGSTSLTPSITSTMPTSGQEPLATSENSGTVPASGQEPPSTVVSSTSPNEMISLRAEVENLRRVMVEIQTDRVEAPPSYEEN
ncbi:uncharacterized protein LAESUDRAFT_643898 [Laetiporus sulphureus 93-53]|uniref:DUF1793-domain-containing protein n=1 Tax=Laetiporus sulphureus 93-53 TaxID=1314785 RepID=A0A165GRM0_9APHY|nr:uncharacterized protein LAESUDRAFT_643898 [Laetiporus sulphureus 93-53]KZT10711.1 hypothetical protein LAESUDRAFT_643898 [Laetiporus sulphureus 93-53]